MLNNPVFTGIEASAGDSSQHGYVGPRACDWRIAVDEGSFPARRAHGASGSETHGLRASASDPLADQTSSSGSLTENPVYIAYNASTPEYSSPTAPGNGVDTADRVSMSAYSPPGHRHEYDYVSPVRDIARGGDMETRTMSSFEPSRGTSACRPPVDEHVYDHVLPGPAMALDGDVTAPALPPRRRPQALTSDGLTENPAYVASGR